jgi:hypothetical protein
VTSPLTVPVRDGQQSRCDWRRALGGGAEVVGGNPLYMRPSFTFPGLVSDEAAILRLFVTKTPRARDLMAVHVYHVMMAARCETRQAALGPVFDGRLVCRIGAWCAPLHPRGASRGASGGHDDQCWLGGCGDFVC